MPPQDLRVNLKAEERLRKTISNEFRRKVTELGSESAAADDLGISRQRLSQYLKCRMTPKSDVLLVAAWKWNLSIEFEGKTFGLTKGRRRPPAQVTGQLTFDYFDEPCVLHNDDGKVEVKLSRKKSDRLALELEIQLAS
jgi:hypothetical protein